LTKTDHPDVAAGDAVYLIDGSGFIFRAYHALPPLTRKSDGLPIGAVQGFCAMLNKLLRETNAGARPTHIAVVFDKSEKTFRNEIYPEYKAHRPPAPEDLIPQFPLVREAVKAFNVPCVEQLGYEADDLIATYAAEARDKGATVRIISSDKDLMQLVGDRIRMVDAMKDKEFGVAEVIEKFGVPPSKVVDVQALAGDSVDNVPGVPGIGLKTAAQLVNEHGDLEAILAHAGEIKQPKRRENLLAHAEAARLSKRLVTLKRDVPLDTPLRELRVREPDPEALIGFLKGLELTTLTRRIASDLGVEAAGVEAKAVAATHAAVPAGSPAVTPASSAGLRMKPPALAPFGSYSALTRIEQLADWSQQARLDGRIAIHPVMMSAELTGLALASAPGKAVFIPLASSGSGEFDFAAAGVERLAAKPALPLGLDPADGRRN